MCEKEEKNCKDCARLGFFDSVNNQIFCTVRICNNKSMFITKDSLEKELKECSKKHSILKKKCNGENREYCSKCPAYNGREFPMYEIY